MTGSDALLAAGRRLRLLQRLLAEGESTAKGELEWAMFMQWDAPRLREEIADA